jgi:hypothetical protein
MKSLRLGTFAPLRWFNCVFLGSSSCGLCKPWKQGWADKKTARDIRHGQRAEQQLREGGF